MLCNGHSRRTLNINACVVNKLVNISRNDRLLDAVNFEINGPLHSEGNFLKRLPIKTYSQRQINLPINIFHQPIPTWKSNQLSSTSLENNLRFVCSCWLYPWKCPKVIIKVVLVAYLSNTYVTFRQYAWGLHTSSIAATHNSLWGNSTRLINRMLNANYTCALSFIKRCLIHFSRIYRRKWNRCLE